MISYAPKSFVPDHANKSRVYPNGTICMTREVRNDLAKLPLFSALFQELAKVNYGATVKILDENCSIPQFPDTADEDGREVLPRDLKISFNDELPEKMDCHSRELLKKRLAIFSTFPITGFKKKETEMMQLQFRVDLPIAQEYIESIMGSLFCAKDCEAILQSASGYVELFQANLERLGMPKMKFTDTLHLIALIVAHKKLIDQHIKIKYYYNASKLFYLDKPAVAVLEKFFIAFIANGLDQKTVVSSKVTFEDTKKRLAHARAEMKSIRTSDSIEAYYEAKHEHVRVIMHSDSYWNAHFRSRTREAAGERIKYLVHKVLPHWHAKQKALEEKFRKAKYVMDVKVFAIIDKKVNVVMTRLFGKPDLADYFELTIQQKEEFTKAINAEIDQYPKIFETESKNSPEINKLRAKSHFCRAMTGIVIDEIKTLLISNKKDLVTKAFTRDAI